jgi:NapC/NirT cytochrome c family, N-terminal region
MKLPKSFYNLTSFIGATLVAICLFLMAFMFIIGFFYSDSSSYLGLFTYVIFPVFLVIGLFLIPIGMFFNVKKKKSYLDKGWPIVDLNKTSTRNALIVFGIGTLFFMFLTSIGSYEAFHYSESVEFCGTLCHEVMEPEHVAYQYSPHARVACVDCHVGEGADWYVRSKLSGLRQVYHAIKKDYPRPIPTPIVDLRPAQETCERCHWPEKFYARQLRNFKHYLANKENSEWNLSMQMKIGPSHSAMGLSEGIHWHINPKVNIEYIPKDYTRMKIPWIKYTNIETGEINIYQDSENVLSEEEIAKGDIRGMDCIDCHNRPSHHYYAPSEFVDNAMVSGDIPKDLPSIKKVAMKVLHKEYNNRDSAKMQIEEYIWKYYNKKHKDLVTTDSDKIEKAIDGIMTGFNKNIFPEMKVTNKSYPSFLGHKMNDGCFRCHNGTHVNEDGKSISRDCNLCHDIVLQGKTGEEEFSSIKEFLEFKHPEDIDGMWNEVLCSECHSALY